LYHLLLLNVVDLPVDDFLADLLGNVVDELLVVVVDLHLQFHVQYRKIPENNEKEKLKEKKHDHDREKEHDLVRFFSFLDFFPPPPILRIPLQLILPVLTPHLQALMAVFVEVFAKKI